MSSIEHLPDCRPEHLTKPDEEGLSDCTNCGLWEQTLLFPEWCDGPERVVPRAECHLVKVPTLFYEDHVQRDLTAGVVTNEGRVVTQVWLDTVCIDDLVGDAKLYAGFAGEDYKWNRSLCDSARSTLRSLERQLPPCFCQTTPGGYLVFNPFCPLHGYAVREESA